MFRKMMTISLFLILALVLAACGGDGDDDGGDGDSGSSDVNLSQSFSAEDAGSSLTLNFDYPDGWAADETNFGVANSQEVLDSAVNADNPEFDGEDIAVLFLILPPEMGSALGLAPEAGPSDVVSLVTGLIFEGNETNLSDVADFDAGDNSGAITSGTATVDGVESSGTIAVVQTAEDTYVAVVGRYGDDADGEATVRAIAATVATE